MSARSWPPPAQPPYGPPPPYGTWPPRPQPPPQPVASGTLILARIAAITLAGIALLVGFLGSALIMTPTTMMFTGCSADSACLWRFFWVFALPPVACCIGAVVALVGILVQWRSHWVVTWGVVAIVFSVTGIVAALRIAGSI